ncbi:unnamed protein product [Durusdinium trenchii]|uniref:Sulfotransferase n=1 Tax=Durusdinium trenchii TaxID=1381693 RepID=A0ABP0KBC3_9DINO
MTGRSVHPFSPTTRPSSVARVARPQEAVSAAVFIAAAFLGRLQQVLQLAVSQRPQPPATSQCLWCATSAKSRIGLTQADNGADSEGFPLALLQVDLQFRTQRERLNTSGRADASRTPRAPLCMAAHRVPEVYLLGAPKAGTTSLALQMFLHGVWPAVQWGHVAEDVGHLKEFHFFDDGEAVRRNRTQWLEHLPSCEAGAFSSPSPRSARSSASRRTAVPPVALGDFTPRNLRLVPLPAGIQGATPLMAEANLPATLERFYGQQAQRLVFVVLLREPLSLFQSMYYLAKGRNFTGQEDLEASTFQESLQKSLNLAKHQIYSDDLWAGLYSWHLSAYLQHFDASQFIISPMEAYVRSFAPDLCRSLSERLERDLCGEDGWRQAPHMHHTEHPPLAKELGAAATLVEAMMEFLEPERQRLLEVLGKYSRGKARLIGYQGKVGSQTDIDGWLKEFGIYGADEVESLISTDEITAVCVSDTYSIRMKSFWLDHRLSFTVAMLTVMNMIFYVSRDLVSKHPFSKHYAPETLEDATLRLAKGVLSPIFFLGYLVILHHMKTGCSLADAYVFYGASWTAAFDLWEWIYRWPLTPLLFLHHLGGLLLCLAIADIRVLPLGGVWTVPQLLFFCNVSVAWATDLIFNVFYFATSLETIRRYRTSRGPGVGPKKTKRCLD